MAVLPTMRLGEVEVSRLICGSNPFLGYSYRSPAHNAWQREVMTTDRIARLLEKCLECGINTMAGNYDDEGTLHQARVLCEKRVGKAPHWIAYTHGPLSGQLEVIDKLADQGAFAIYIQGGQVDSCFNYNYVGAVVFDGQDRMEQVVPWLARIRERGCVPGLGSHRPQIIELAEQRGYDAEFYALPLNFVGVYCDYAPAVRVINEIKKPFVAIKALGGSARIPPEEGFTCAFTALKKTDGVAAGIENEQSVEYNAAYVAGLLAMLDGKTF